MPAATAPRGAPQASSIGMFIIELTFAVSLTKVHANAAAHISFLRRQYARGIFLIARRPRPGGREIILAVAPGREQLQSLMREDPFCELGLADVRIVRLDARARAVDHSSVLRQTAAAPATRSAPRRRRLRWIHAGHPESREPGNQVDGRRETHSSLAVAAVRDMCGTPLPRQSPARRISVVWGARQAGP
jgi:uncharacterized protein YciI